LYVDIENSKERLETNKDIWEAVKVNEFVELRIVRGGLGFKYVSEINPL